MPTLAARKNYRNSLRALLGTALLIAAAVLSVTGAFAQGLSVTLDQAKVIKLPERVSTIVVGNPLIADVSVQAGGMMVVTGKGYGVTNLLAIDRTGAVLLEEVVQVRGPRDGVIVVYRGAERESYSCVPSCEQRVTLGDTQKFFDASLNQTVVRTGQASGTAR